MSVAYSLVPGLDDIVKNGDPKRRGDAVLRLSELFVQGAANFNAGHVDLFDGILTTLAPQTEIEIRCELAERLSALTNAPPDLVRQLVREEEISIAGPLLRRSPLVDDTILLEIAGLRGQAHLMAISERPTLPPPLTDVLVRRGDRDVMRRVAGNAGAKFSQGGHLGLIRRAGDDGALALAVGLRSDLSPAMLKVLLACSPDVVRRRLLDAANPAAKSAISAALGELSGPPATPGRHRDFAPAQRAIVKLHNAGGLNEAAMLGFAKAHKYEESVAALSAMSGVRIETLDQLVMGERHDPILILGKSQGFEWATVRAMISLRLGPGRAPAASDIEEARLNFERLAPTAAQRVLNFWRTRQNPSGSRS
jgi:uncharacterized protein (DUF2336 family)